MTKPPLGFNRLVLGLQPGAPHRGMELAVQFAELFEMELLGLFIEDIGLRRLAGFPDARELSSTDGGWSRIEPAQWIRDLNRVAESAERRFVAATGRLTRRQFEVVGGGAAAALANIARSEDILVIGAPAAAERAAEPFASLLEAALRSNSAVMLAPARPARRSGSIVAIAARANDPSIEAATAIAVALGEDCIVLEPRAVARHVWRGAAEMARAPDAIWRGAAPRRTFAAEAMPHALQGSNGRFAVVTRGALADEIVLAIAATADVPVLSLDSRERSSADRAPRWLSPR